MPLGKSSSFQHTIPTLPRYLQSTHVRPCWPIREHLANQLGQVLNEPSRGPMFVLNAEWAILPRWAAEWLAGCRFWTQHHIFSAPPPQQVPNLWSNMPARCMIEFPITPRIRCTIPSDHMNSPSLAGWPDTPHIFAVWPGLVFCRPSSTSAPQRSEQPNCAHSRTSWMLLTSV